MSYNDMLLNKQNKTLIFLIRPKQRLKYHKRKSLEKYKSDKQCYKNLTLKPAPSMTFGVQQTTGLLF